MYQYDSFDHQMVRDRARQFRGQVERRIEGKLSEDEFKPLRLMNGLYLQLHAYMLRVAIPYGTLNGDQLHALAHIARVYDKGYGHFTTRQNLQYNWPKLDDVPALLDELAGVEMHAIQTSGNCIRNVTTDQYAGAVPDEVEDPRITSELLRQWSSFHPEFSFLPRKFKIAVTATKKDRAAIRVHDIGLEVVKDENGAIGYRVFVGGGQGRTPVIAVEINSFVPRADLVAYLEAILRVYNRFGRRDNKYKARIKILVKETGAEEFARLVAEEFEAIKDTVFQLPAEEVTRIMRAFDEPAFERLSDESETLDRHLAENKDFAQWVRSNVVTHRAAGYAIANISLKPIGGVPGDATAQQMDLVADLANRYSFGDVRVTHEQNLVLPHVKKDDLFTVWQALQPMGLATPNLGMVTDIIACPGLDYCDLANARSIPVSQMISERFRDLEQQHNIGELKIKISGCINACGHHHVGHIGILGVDKKGTEHYQITLGGTADETASIGKILGPSFTYEEIADAIETIVTTYLSIRERDEEVFLETVRRVGFEPFKEALYGTR